MNYYMLLLRSEKIDFGSYSQEDYGKILAEFDAWNAGMIEEERLIASGNLKDRQGKTLIGGIVKDGPYSETKEAVTGFFLIRAEDYEKATSIASGCPFLVRGGSVEVRWMPQLEFEDIAFPIMQENAKARIDANSKGAKND